MNKQYVNERIEMAVKAIEDKYDAVIKNIYQCPDCGALAFRNGEHICLRAALGDAAMPRKRKAKTLADYVLQVLPTVPPSDPTAIFEQDSPYMPKQIGKLAKLAGFSGKVKPSGVTMTKFLRSGKVECMPVRTREVITTKSGVHDRICSGMAYWRSA